MDLFMDIGQPAELTISLWWDPLVFLIVFWKCHGDQHQACITTLEVVWIFWPSFWCLPWEMLSGRNLKWKGHDPEDTHLTSFFWHLWRTNISKILVHATKLISSIESFKLFLIISGWHRCFVDYLPHMENCARSPRSDSKNPRGSSKTLWRVLWDGRQHIISNCFQHLYHPTICAITCCCRAGNRHWSCQGQLGLSWNVYLLSGENPPGWSQFQPDTRVAKFKYLIHTRAIEHTSTTRCE